MRITRSPWTWMCAVLVASAPARLEAQERPYIYGCGMIWSKWLEDDKGKKYPRSYDEKSMDRIKEMGGTNCPIDIPWIQVEPEPGKWDFDYVDFTVAAAQKRGLAMFAYIGLTPNWALPSNAPKDKDGKFKDGIGYRFPPDEKYAEAFETYCRTVAKRYKGKIKHYQFWNEPNGCSWINDGCSNGHMAHTYAPWLIRCYKAMKAEDPDCMIAAGALDYHAGVKDGYKWIEDLYKNGGKDHFDAISIHPYDRQGTLHWKAIEDTRRVMVEHGDGDKVMWLNEWGWNNVPETEKAKRVIEVLTRLKDPKYSFVYQANYLSITDPGGEPGYGLCDRDLKPRASYEAYKSVDKKFPKSTTQPAGKAKATAEEPAKPAAPSKGKR